MVRKIRSNTSFSQIKSYRDCPRSWFVQKILGEEQPQSDRAKRGTQFDTMIAQRLGLLQPAVGEPQEVLGERVEEAVEFYLNHPKAWKQATSAQEAVELKPNQWKVLAQEYGIEFELDLPLIGYIDLARDSGVSREIVDLKTSDRRDFRADWALQASLYCLIKRAQRFEIHLLTFTQKLALYTYAYRPTAETFRWAMQLIGSTHTRMRATETAVSSEEVEATPGYHCAWCPREMKCEAAFVGRLTHIE